MKQQAASALVSVLLFSAATIIAVEVAEANPLPWLNPKITITIQSPQNGTSHDLPVFVNFTAQCSWEFTLSDSSTQEDWIKTFYYVLDGQDMGSSGTNFTEIQLTAKHPTDKDHYYEYNGEAYLTNLTDGSHSITVYYGALVNVDSPQEFIAYDEDWSATSQFYVNIGAAPEHSLIVDPNFSLYTGLTLLIIVLTTFAGLLVYFKKRKR